MGISADLILFTKDGEDIIDDLNEEITLFEFLPKKLHHLIYKDKIEIIDIKFYQDHFGDKNLYVASQCGNRVVFSNGIQIRDVKALKVECNKINAKTLVYIGSASSFVEDIYSLYHARPSFKSLWKSSEIDNIVHEPLCCPKNILADHDADFVYIDLNY